MNSAIRNIQLFLFLLFGLLILRLTLLQIIQSSWYVNQPTNGRLYEEQTIFNRGSIYSNKDHLPPLAKNYTNEADTSVVTRQYGMDNKNCYVTGYIGKYKSAGIEKAYNSYLSGVEAQQNISTFLNTSINEQPTGYDVITTIDLSLQNVAWDELNKPEYKKYEGVVVALDATNGDVLAFTATPGYSPGDLANPELFNEAYNKGNDPEQGKRLLNPITSEVYPPGSVFKIITMAALLESGMNPNTTYPDPPVYQVPNGKQVNNYDRGKPCKNARSISLEEAFTVSCNTTFVQAALDIGDQKLINMAQQFGIGQKFSWDLANEDPSRIPDRLDPSGLADSAIGQYEVRVTPMRMAMVAATIANQGVMMKPRIVSEIKDKENRTITTGEAPTPIINPKTGAKNIISENTSAQLTHMMNTVVTEGTGRAAAVSGAEVAGKTGTAELGSQDKRPHSWFVGFTTTEKRKIAIAVLVKEGGTGGGISAKIAKRVLQTAVVQDRQ